LVQAVLKDWQSAPVNVKLRAMLGFLEKLTLHPGTIKPEDITPLRSVGLSDTAIEDAIYVCVYFNIIDRMADSLGFAVPPTEVFMATAASPATSSYALPPT
jgi:alkylhydroperoxidase family enzyme